VRVFPLHVEAQRLHGKAGRGINLPGCFFLPSQLIGNC